MTFEKALEILKNGGKITRPPLPYFTTLTDKTLYYQMIDGIIKGVQESGKTYPVGAFEIAVILADDWQEYNEIPVEEPKSTMTSLSNVEIEKIIADKYNTNETNVALKVSNYYLTYDGNKGTMPPITNAKFEIVAEVYTNNAE